MIDMEEKTLADEKNKYVAEQAMGEVLAALHERYGSCLDMEEEARDLVEDAILAVLQRHYK